MKILAPVGNYAGALSQIEAGADEIYLGGDSEIFDYFTYSARVKYNHMGEKNFLDDHEIQDIVQLAHQNNVAVIYAANFPFLAEDVSGTQKYIRNFLAYVDKGIKAGVDSVILGDIGAILLLKKEGYDIHITASTYFETINTWQLHFLKELGVNRAVISYQVGIDEIKKLCACNLMEIEIFGHNGCSFYDANCNMHNCKTGATCTESFDLVDGEGIVGSGRIIDANQYCSLCSLLRLKKMGVYAIKLVGREGSSQKNAEITKLYSEFLAGINKFETSDDMDEESFIDDLKEKIVPPWWRRVYCKAQLCRYTENRVTKAFV